MKLFVNLKNNRVDQDYFSNLDNVIVIPNKEDLYKIDYNYLASNNIIDNKFKYVLLGHKDYRKSLSEEIINKQVKESLKQGIKVILCVNSVEVLKQDLTNIKDYKYIIIAYEVDNYIGTNKTLSNKEIESFIKEVKSISNDLKVIYGGGITLDNVKELLKIKDLYGLLISSDYKNIDKYKELL